MNSIKYILLVFLILLTAVLLSCDTVESNESGTLYIKYVGIENNENGSVASFLLVNDTSETIEYWAYSENVPHYSTEVLTDTGWTYLMFNWCGTGTNPIELKPGAIKKFTTPLPKSDCTWRVILDVYIINSDKYYNLKSDEIKFTVPQN